MPDALLCSSYLLTHLIISASCGRRYYYYLHFTDLDTEEQEKELQLYLLVEIK